MNTYRFTFRDATLDFLPSGALHWPDEGLLCVSDLHLGRSERYARRAGALLPPYEARETLTRLQADIDATAATTVICLGDSFDDDAAAAGLDEPVALWIARLMAGRRWVWIEGNHDPGPVELGGTHRDALTLGPLTFRHIATADAVGEVSGHYHPKARIAGRARPCLLADRQRLILPAYGTYTGGLRSTDPALTALMAADARAVLTGPRPVPIPMPR
ncbi:ligase-associated DNA damage response endonuclease PdeM [Maritimibacter sp. DP07]|uniref:Ligase-associated DNA damage response endonuclease PdeM n=1 Tax=Maritimibacter harenae TaxID=2606218 RepID=A0A845M6G9_9RHOB|nr:ligase-associated DNA damage response endonuclease PdeM [Maritimibacter harenae]MZR11761.1 ligase-associated DNA damage response endonuclease PdeM [Maritimibacter harenae]